jgi:predicted RNA binding protein YcfA (HicA-like mRNA interferase family)
MNSRKANQEVEEWRTNRSDIRFDRFCAVIEHFGFKCRGGKGSHKVYVRDGVVENLSVQEVKSKAKPYQIRQFIDLVDRYNLIGGERGI